MAAAVAGIGVIDGAKEDQSWALFYWFPLGLGLVNLGLVWLAFGFGREIVEVGDETEHTEGEHRSSHSAWHGLREAMREKVVWTLSLFYFFHLGVSITAGGKCTPFSWQRLLAG